MSLDLRRQIRVFLSYSRDNGEMAARMVNHLEQLGVTVMHDQDIGPGTEFFKEIPWRISFAHIFICLLTEVSQKSPWVITELGYALGARVPVLPICIGTSPEGLAKPLNALILKGDFSDLEKKVTRSSLDELVDRARIDSEPASEVKDRLRERTQFLVSETQRVYLYAKGRFPNHDFRIRQRAAFTSFSIPDRSPDHPMWTNHAVWNKLGETERELLRRERQILEAHATSFGCVLIIDPFVLPFEAEEDIGDGKPVPQPKYPVGALIARLETLLKFLKAQDPTRCAVTIRKGRIHGNRTIIGDWLCADAIVPHYKNGYRQTIFSRHGPTVLSRIQEFDREFDDSLEASGFSRNESCGKAMDEITKIINGFDPGYGGTSA